MSKIVRVEDCPLGTRILIKARINNTYDYDSPLDNCFIEQAQVIGKRNDDPTFILLGFKGCLGLDAYQNIDGCIDPEVPDWDFYSDYDKYQFYWSLYGFRRVGLMNNNPNQKCTICQIPIPHALEETTNCLTCQSLAIFQ